MMNRIIHFVCFSILVISNINAQSHIDNVLVQIEKNNKSILVHQQYAESQKLRFKTGLSLQNPSIVYEFGLGSPSGVGNQSELAVLQSFDFPTAYAMKKQVAALQTGVAYFELNATRKDILLEAKQTCIKLVYYNKKQGELKKRLENAEKLLSDYQKKMSNGEANILDVNKVKLQQINLQNDLRLNSGQMTQLNEKLTELNGDVAIQFDDSVYPIHITLPPYDKLMDSVEANNPALNLLEQEKEINHKKVELAKAMILPKMEVGYLYQSGLGQRFHGMHLGMTIPLWENKHVVDAQKAQIALSNLKIEEHSNEHHAEIRQLYSEYQNLDIALKEYQQVLSTSNNTDLLGKALKLGEISSIEYFMEINYFYSSFDKFLEMEKEFYLVVAELYGYEL